MTDGAETTVPSSRIAMRACVGKCAVVTSAQIFVPVALKDMVTT